jgi:rsbT co-antagonist protein RsbR
LLPQLRQIPVKVRVVLDATKHTAKGIRADDPLEKTQMNQSLLDRFEISADDLSLLKECGQALGAATIDRVVDRFYQWLPKQPEFKLFFDNKDEVERVKKLQKVYWVQFFSGIVDDRYIEYRVHIGDLHARRDLPSEVYFAGMLQFQLFFMDELQKSLGSDQLLQVLSACTKLIALDTYVTSDQISQFAKRRVTESSKAMLAMSTPVTSIWDGILLLPLVGVVDSQRTKDIMEKVLSRISESRARVFVMDISGVVAVDTAVANHFIKVTQATRLMGCQCIISGISPNVAQTLVELGANVGDVRTTATLSDALQIALETIRPAPGGGAQR